MYYKSYRLVNNLIGGIEDVSKVTPRPLLTIEISSLKLSEREEDQMRRIVDHWTAIVLARVFNP